MKLTLDHIVNVVVMAIAVGAMGYSLHASHSGKPMDGNTAAVVLSVLGVLYTFIHIRNHGEHQKTRDHVEQAARDTVDSVHDGIVTARNDTRQTVITTAGDVRQKVSDVTDAQTEVIARKIEAAKPAPAVILQREYREPQTVTVTTTEKPRGKKAKP